MPHYADRLPAQQPQARRQEEARTKPLPGAEAGTDTRSQLQRMANERYERKQAERAARQSPAKPQKLEVGSAHDPLEAEADQAAQEVVNGKGKDSGDLGESGDGKAMSKPLAMRITRKVQREEAEESQMKAMREEGEESAMMKAQRAEEEGQMKAMREEGEESAMMKAQRAEEEGQMKAMREEGEESAMMKAQRAEEEGQMKAMREEGEESAMMKAQRAEEEGQMKAMRVEGEESAMMKAQRAEEEGQMKAMREEGEESAMMKAQRAEEEGQMKAMRVEGEESAMMKAMREEEEKAQLRGAPQDHLNGFTAGEDTAALLQQRKGKGEQLPGPLKAEMEQGFGTDLSEVRIHRDAPAAELNQDLKAKAFTVGGDVFFNKGQFDPATKGGKELIAHELAHTVQQGAVEPQNTPEGAAVAAPGQEKSAADKQAGAGLPVPAAQGNASAPPPAPEAPAAEAAEPEAKQGEEKDKEASAEGEGGGKEEPKLPDSPKDPADDPAFQAVLATNEANAQQQAVHTDAETEVAELQGAAVLPQEAQAEEADMEGHMAAMEDVAEQQERQPFTPATFKEKLKANLDELEKQLPNDADSAEEFKEEEPIKGVKEDIAGQVADEKDKIAGPLEASAGAEEAPATGAPTIAETPIAAEDPGPMAPDLDPAAAVPKPFADHEISMEEESASLDEKMAEHDVTEEQLEKSNEPEFLDGLSKKREAQQKAADAPGVYRGQEAGILDQAQGGALEQGQTAAYGMLTARVEGLGAVMGGQVTGETTSETEQDRIKAEFQKIYIRTKEEVNTQLEAITTQVTELFDNEAETAKTTFETNVEEKLDDIYGLTVLDDMIFGEDTEAIEKVFVEEKATFVTTMDGVLDRIATIIADGLNGALATIAKGREESKVFYDGLDESQKKLAEESYGAFNDQYAALEDTVYEKEDELARDLAQSYKDNVDGLRESFDKIKEEVAAGWIGGALNALVGIIETIIKIGEMLANLLSAVIEAVGAILSDPIGFLSNLIDGVKLGFEQFFTNIKTHIISGLIEWLTGSLGGVGITLPENIFSLSGVFDLTMQILGLGWDFLREKAVKLLGEPVVQAMEIGADLFIKLKNGGIDALWEELKEQFQDIQQVVMDAIRDMVITKVVEAGIKWIMGLLSPAGAFIKAAMMVIDIVTFFVERASSIIDLVMAFIDGIRALAKGDVSSVANAIEKSLAKAIPILIGFLAALVGVTGLAGKVQNIVKKIRKRIDKAVTKVIKKIGRKFKGKGGKDKKGGKGDEKDEGKPDKDGLTPADKKKHAKIGKAIQKKMSKVAAKGKDLTFEELHAAKKKEAAALEQQYQKDLNPNIKLSITIGDLAADKKDGDVDVKVRIAPNTYEVKFNIEGEEDHAEFKKLVHLALETAGGEARGGDLNVENFKVGEKKLDDVQTEASTKKGREKRKAETDQEKAGIDAAKAKEKEELKETSNTIHNEIRKSMVDFKHASSAQYFPNNTFQVGGGDFFVETYSNNYIFPTGKAKGSYTYGLGGASTQDILTNGAEQLEKKYRGDLQLDRTSNAIEQKKRQLLSFSIAMSTPNAPKWEELLQNPNLAEAYFKVKPIPAIQAKFVLARQLALDIQQASSGLSTPTLPANYQNTVDMIRAMANKKETPSQSLKQLEFIKNFKEPGIFEKEKSAPVDIRVPQKLFGAYPYGALKNKPLQPQKAKKLYAGFPGSIKNASTENTLFVASLIVEPTRSDASYITNILLLNEDSTLRNDTQAPPKVESQSIVDGKIENQKLEPQGQSTGLFDHNPMAQGSSDPKKKKHQDAVNRDLFDPDIESKSKDKVYINVSNRNLATIKLNAALQGDLETIYKTEKAAKKSQEEMVKAMANKIKAHFKLD